MHRRSPNTSTASKSSPVAENPSTTAENRRRKIGRPPILFFSLIFLLIYGSWGVYHYQFEVLPAPLSPKQAGKRGFSEELAMQHVIALTKIGPHPVGSEALELAFQYVLEASKRIKESAHWEVNVEVDLFHAKTGVNRLIGGIFKGKTHVYSDLKHVVLRISPKYLPEAEERAVLVSSHIDTVFSTQGAGDCSSCVAVMLELARGMSQWAHGFQNSIIFLFNTGEEEGLIGAHSFITQHPWRSTIRFFVDLEAMGIGGKSSIFQTGGDSWAIEAYSRVSKYPSGMITAQDLFRSGAIKSATDFQVYAEVAGLPGLDFAYVDSSAVYHTKNDKLELLKPGSLQHLGGDMLSFLLEVGKSSNLSTGKEHEIGQPIFFDVMGMFMVLYSKHFSNLLNNSVIAQSLIIWTASILLGGYAGVGALGLSFLSIILTWVFSVAFSLLVVVLLPLIGPSPTPYVASPWLLLGLFAAPALLGALTGQSLGFIFLQKYLHHVSPERGPNISALQAERWVFKTGFIQWLCALILGNYFNLGSSFVALVWLVSPALAYGLIEATLTPARSPKPLRVVTLVLGSIVPLLVSAGMIIRLVGTMVGIMVRFERNPGAMPEWLGSAALAVLISALTCLVFVFFLSYLHLSGAKKAVVVMLLALLALTLTAVATGIFPPYTEDFARAVNVVHVVESTGDINRVNPTSYTLLFSTTPGKLEREMDSMKGEHFSCGRNRTVDLVTFSVDYGCLSLTDSQEGWAHTDIPLIRVEKDIVVNGVRSTRVSVDTKSSTRWSLSINFNEIEDFTFRDLTWSTGELVSRDKKTSVNGQHVIQFAGGKQSPTKFELELFWYDNKNGSAKEGVADLLKLRTDLNMVTPKVGRILDKLPSWCSLFGKSTFPYTLAFLTSLPVDFKV